MRYASETLVHYFRIVYANAGLQWNEDNESEVTSIVEDIISTVDQRLKCKVYSKEMRQKIASEQLAALIVRNDVPKWGMNDPDNWILDEAIRLTDLLLKKLAEESEA